MHSSFVAGWNTCNAHSFYMCRHSAGYFFTYRSMSFVTIFLIVSFLLEANTFNLCFNSSSISMNIFAICTPPSFHLIYTNQKTPSTNIYRFFRWHCTDTPLFNLMLRDYQTTVIDEIRAHMMAGHKSILLQMPTGAGKTLTTAHMLKTATERSMRAWFIVHRRELVKQSIIAFDKLGLRHGVIGGGISRGSPSARTDRRLGRCRDVSDDSRLLIYSLRTNVNTAPQARGRQLFGRAARIITSA